MEADRITDEVLAEFSEKAARELGHAVQAEDYIALAERAEAEKRHYAAAVYYSLAAVQALPGREAADHQERAREMLWRISDRMGRDEP